MILNGIFADLLRQTRTTLADILNDQRILDAFYSISSVKVLREVSGEVCRL